MEEHVDSTEIKAWMAGELSDDDASRVEAHLESCDSCASIVGEVEPQEDAFESRARELLKSTPGTPGPKPTGRSRLFASEKPGQMVGKYKLIHLIGEGGMGSVWKAEQQEPVRRVVALKIIKAGMDTKEVIARFETERQALALMDHPNIAHVLDAGATETGRSFFVMELVRGVPITEYCDDQKLNTEQRLRLFCDVCHGVQHAHRKGIMHRDIKPTNVLVSIEDQGPVAKIIDFGLAKATGFRLTEKTMFTSIGQMVGTPAYMSPEQAGLTGLDVDTRTDVYSLGVLLYELLTGVTPLDMANFGQVGMVEIQKVIREQDPPAPSTRLSSLDGDSSITATNRASDPRALSHLLKGDLDVIVMKALEKDRNRRYETPVEFANDIQRYLNHEPIKARPASAVYKFKRLYERNRVAFTAAGLIAATVLIGFVVSTFLAVRATRAEKLANERLAESEEVVRLLVDLFQSPDPSRDGHEITVAETLDRAVEKLDGELTGQPGRRARLQFAIGKTYEALGLYKRALPLLEDAHAFFDADAATDDDLLLDVKKIYSMVLHRLDDPRQLDSARDYLATAERIRGKRHIDTLWAMNAVANALPEDERRPKREELVDLAVDVAGPEAPVTVVAKGNLALALSNAGERERSLEMREEVVRLSTKVHGPRAVETLFEIGNLLRAYRSAGRHEEGLPMAREYVEACREVYGPDHRHTFSAMALHAGMLEISGAREEELAVWESVIEGRRRVFGEDGRSTVNSSMFLVGRYMYAGQVDKALALANHLVEVVEAAPDMSPKLVLVVKNNCAYFTSLLPVEDAQQRERALAWAREATTTSPEMAPFWATLGLTSYRVGELEKARVATEKSIELSGEASRSDLLVLAMVLHDLGEEEEARARFEEAGPGTESQIVEPDTLLYEEAQALIESE